MYLYLIVVFIAGHYLLSVVVDTLNLRHASAVLPVEFEGHYDPETYAKSQRYLTQTTRFGMLCDGVGVVFLLGILMTGSFNLLDAFVRRFTANEIGAGLLFCGTLFVLSQLLTLPFSAWRTFVIEERFGFNRTTPATFIFDRIKGIVLSAAIGAPLLVSVIWFFDEAGPAAWIFCWGLAVVLQLFLIFIAPVVIMPLFNKFIPLEDGPLKEAIESYASSRRFLMKGIFKMDGSRRSSKSNAFFTGFGKSRRIALFDTLIDAHTTNELVAVLAHEIGHYKKRHIIKGIIFSALKTGVVFFLMGFFIKNPGLFAAFGMEHLSVYASLVFFGFLYTPVSVVLSAVTNTVSRKHEFEADRYAVETGPGAQPMVDALKKLSVHNLSNLTPHPIKVFLDYTHPPVLERVRAIQSL